MGHGNIVLKPPVLLSFLCGFCSVRLQYEVGEDICFEDTINSIAEDEEKGVREEITKSSWGPKEIEKRKVNRPSDVNRIRQLFRLRLLLQSKGTCFACSP
jgi:hypothetical protein